MGKNNAIQVNNFKFGESLTKKYAVSKETFVKINYGYKGNAYLFFRGHRNLTQQAFLKSPKTNQKM